MKATLVQFKGKGGPGAFWVWDYFVAVHHPLGSTTFHNLTRQEKTQDFMRAVFTDPYWKDRKHQCDLRDRDDVLDFFTGMNAGHAKDVAKAIAELDGIKDYGIPEPMAYCDVCGNTAKVKNLIATNWYSDGGVSYSPHDLMHKKCARKEGYECTY